MKCQKKESLNSPQSGLLVNKRGILTAATALFFIIVGLSGTVRQNASGQNSSADSQFEPICKKKNNNPLSGLHTVLIAGNQSFLAIASVPVSKSLPKVKATNWCERPCHKRLLVRGRSCLGLLSGVGRPTYFLRI